MIVVKLGGAALKHSLQDPALFAALRDAGGPVVIVHGGGPEINRYSQLLGLQSDFIDGQRVTSPEICDVVEMILAGKINPAIVRGLLKVGVNGFGLSGVDAALFECGVENPQLGRVGAVKKVNAALLRTLLSQGLTPVVAPLGIFEKGGPWEWEVCNINADLAAAHLAAKLGAERLLFLTDRDGILDDRGGVMASLTVDKLKELMNSSTISGGMKVKARAILETLAENPRCSVEVMNGVDATALTTALKAAIAGTARSGVGTKIDF